MASREFWRVKTDTGRIVGEYDSPGAAHRAGLWRVRDKRGRLRGEFTDLETARAHKRATDRLYRIPVKVFRVVTRTILKPAHKKAPKKAPKPAPKKARKPAPKPAPKPKRKVSRKPPPAPTPIPPEWLEQARKARATEASMTAHFAPQLPKGWILDAVKARETEAALLAASKPTEKEALASIADEYPAIPQPVRESIVRAVWRHKAWKEAEEQDAGQFRALEQGREFLRKLFGPDVYIISTPNLDGTVDLEVKLAGGLDFLKTEKYSEILEQAEASLPGFWARFGSTYAYNGDPEHGKYYAKGAFPRFYAHPQRIGIWAHNLKWSTNIEGTMRKSDYSAANSTLHLFWNPEGKMPDRRAFEDTEFDL